MVLGTLVSVYVSWAMVPPWPQEQVLLAVPASQLAGVLPAGRASRLDMLAAIATE